MCIHCTIPNRCKCHILKQLNARAIKQDWEKGRKKNCNNLGFKPRTQDQLFDIGLFTSVVSQYTLRWLRNRTNGGNKVIRYIVYTMVFQSICIYNSSECLQKYNHSPRVIFMQTFFCKYIIILHILLKTIVYIIIIHTTFISWSEPLKKCGFIMTIYALSLFNIDFHSVKWCKIKWLMDDAYIWPRVTYIGYIPYTLGIYQIYKNLALGHWVL